MTKWPRCPRELQATTRPRKLSLNQAPYSHRRSSTNRQGNRLLHSSTPHSLIMSAIMALKADVHGPSRGRRAFVGQHPKGVEGEGNSFQSHRSSSPSCIARKRQHASTNPVKGQTCGGKAIASRLQTLTREIWEAQRKRLRQHHYHSEWARNGPQQ